MNDSGFVRLVDLALADANQRGAEWLACRPGCSQCCHGVFAISMLDAARLHTGLRELELADPERAGRLRARVAAACEELTAGYPGDAATGFLFEDVASEERFSEFANEAACPVLDPLTQQCDLYAARPMTCRAFGPPVRTDDGIGVCELCYQGATKAEMEAGMLHLPEPEVEAALTEPFGPERTIIAFALRHSVRLPDLAQL